LEPQSKYQSIIQKLNYYNLVLIAFSLPFPRLFSLYLCVTWIILFLLGGRYRQRFARRKTERGILFLFILFYLYHIAGLLYSSNTSMAWTDIILKLPFLFMPLILFISGSDLSRYKNKILTGFVAGNLTASLLCLIAATFRSLFYFNGHWHFDAELMGHNYTFWQMLANGGNNFMYEALSILIHPGYFSVFIVASIVIILDLLLHKKAGRTVIAKVLNILLIIFFCIMVYLLFARNGLISLFIVLLTYILYGTMRTQIRSVKFAMLAFIAIFTLSGIFLLSRNGRMKNSYYEIKRYIENPASVSKDDDRLFIWGLSMDIIRHNLLIGVGTGDNKDELMKKYREKEMEEALKARLNVHNQYLETSIQLGVIGLAGLLGILVSSVIMAIRKRNLLLLMISFITGLFLLFESALNTQSGVFFFVFILSVLLFIPKEPERDAIFS